MTKTTTKKEITKLVVARRKRIAKSVKLRKQGNSIVMTVPNEVKEALGYSSHDQNFKVKYIIEDGEIKSQRATEVSDEDVIKAALESMEQYDELYKALVNK